MEGWEHGVCEVQSLWDRIMISLVLEELRVRSGCKRGKEGKRRSSRRREGQRRSRLTLGAPAPSRFLRGLKHHWERCILREVSVGSRVHMIPCVPVGTSTPPHRDVRLETRGEGCSWQSRHRGARGACALTRRAAQPPRKPHSPPVP